MPAASTSSSVADEVAVALTGDLDSRGVDVIPVIAAPTILPPALRDRQAVDLTGDVSGGVERHVTSIEAMSHADFSTLTPSTWEQLVADLLWAVGPSPCRIRTMSSSKCDYHLRFRTKRLCLRLAPRCKPCTFAESVGGPPATESLLISKAQPASCVPDRNASSADRARSGIPSSASTSLTLGVSTLR